MTWRRQKETRGCKYTRERRREVKTKTMTVDHFSSDFNLTCHHTNLHFVYVCFPTEPPERDHMWADFSLQSPWSQSAEATPPCSCCCCCCCCCTKCFNTEHADRPNRTKSNTALQSVLRNKPVRCEVDRMNGSPDEWITDRHTETLCFILSLDLA